MVDRDRIKSISGARLWVWVMYSSPWDRLCGWLMKHHKVEFDQDDNILTPEFEVKEGSLRDRLAVQAEKLDRRWVAKYARRYLETGIKPPRRWQRT